jgi:hypothetical protein
MAKQGNQSASGHSGSPLATRRGNADPTDVDPSPVQTNTGMFDYDKNTLQPSGPIEPGGAIPPIEVSGAGEK